MLRYLVKAKEYSFLNITGLVVAFLSSAMIFIWVLDEASYNRFLEEGGEEIHEVMTNFHFSESNIATWERAPLPLSAKLKDSFSEISEATIVSQTYRFKISKGEDAFLTKQEGIYASQDFFKVFKFPLLKGNLNNLLNSSQNIVISEGLAKKIYGDQWELISIIGTTVTLNDKADYQITGVFKDLHKKSTLEFDFVAPLKSEIKDPAQFNNWGNLGYSAYVTVNKGTNLDVLNTKVRGVVNENWKEAEGHVFAFLFPFEDLYLYSEFSEGVNVGGKIKYVKIFIGIAVMILLISFINFINLTVAQSIKRSKEVIMRKIMGSSYFSIRLKFIKEAIFVSLIAFLLSIVILSLVLPYYNSILEKDISLMSIAPKYLIFALLVVLISGGLSGIYPALLTSSFKITQVLKGKMNTNPGSKNVRQVLMLFQFTISLVMIVGALMVNKQLNYLVKKDIGLDIEHTIAVNLNADTAKKFDAFKNELLSQPGVKGVTSASSLPFSIQYSTSGLVWEGRLESSDELLFKSLFTDYDFVDVMGLELISGRNFSRDLSTDINNFIVNQTAANSMGFGDDALGKSLEGFGRKGIIVGVVKDFHTESLFHSISPFVMALENSTETKKAFVRLHNGINQNAIDLVKARIEKEADITSLNYNFLEADYQELYAEVDVVKKLIYFFTAISIIISCLGIFGLTALSVQQKMGEIGMRKILGAKNDHLVYWMSKNLIVLVVISFVIAAPLAYYFISNWLKNFAYNANISAGEFFIALILEFAIIALTISYQTMKVIRSNPTEVIRGE